MENKKCLKYILTFVSSISEKMYLKCLIIVMSATIAFAVNLNELSYSIYETIENFYSKYSRFVDVIDIDGTNGEIANEIMKRLNNSISVTFRSTLKWVPRVENQAILLFGSFYSL